MSAPPVQLEQDVDIPRDIHSSWAVCRTCSPEEGRYAVTTTENSTENGTCVVGHVEDVVLDSNHATLERHGTQSVG